MSDLVTEEDLARARIDPEFRLEFMAGKLEMLLEALNKMRRASDTQPEAARQIREGVDLAVKLADRLQQKGGPRRLSSPDGSLPSSEYPINRLVPSILVGS